jgi:hypothetical protein
MMARKYRVLILNGLTFLSLLCGTCAILVSAAIPEAADAPRYLWVAGLLILASYLIDWCDGMVARFLHASTALKSTSGHHACSVLTSSLPQTSTQAASVWPHDRVPRQASLQSWFLKSVLAPGHHEGHVSAFVMTHQSINMDKGLESALEWSVWSQVRVCGVSPVSPRPFACAPPAPGGNTAADRRKQTRQRPQTPHTRYRGHPRIGHGHCVHASFPWSS